MCRVHTYEFFKSRLKMTKALLGRFEAKNPRQWRRGAIKYATDEAAKAGAATKEADRPSVARGLYHADVNLHQFDRPVSRFSAFFFLGLGLVLLLIPTIVSVCRAMGGFIS